MRSHVFNILQFWKNPEECYFLGEDKATDYDFDEYKAEIRLSAKKTFTEWALITHDQDVYTEYDEDQAYERLIKKVKKENPGMEPDEVEREAQRRKYVFAGNKKYKHTHIVARCKTAIEPSQVAKWLGIPVSMVAVPKGRGAFADCLYYLTHEGEKEQAAGKHLYSRDLVKSNFKWQDILRQSKDMLAGYGQELNIRDFLRTKVRYEGYSIERLMAEFPDYKVDIMNDEQVLKKCRKEYIDHIPIPSYRINYYIEGPTGGIGKGIACRALAHSLYPELEDFECFFEVGGKNVSFEGYNGQPVIIWNDWRAQDFLQQFNRGGTFDLLDSHPTSSKRNIKYGSITLTNTINLINSVQPYQEFLDRLAGEYSYMESGAKVEVKAEDKNQAYRRFPIIICLRDHDFDVLLNKGIALGSYEYEQYISYAHVRGSFGEVAKRLSGAAKEQKLISMTKPALAANSIVEEQHRKYISEPDEIPDDMKDYGEVLDGQITLEDMLPGATPAELIAAQATYDELMHRDLLDPESESQTPIELRVAHEQEVAERMDLELEADSSDSDSGDGPFEIT